MARAGSLDGSLDPFGGSRADFSAYNIRDTKAQLEAYQADVQWANGDLSDADYLAALRKQLALQSPGTRDAIAAQNKLDDVTYRIGRQAAQDQGLDALIAFDQSSLAKMTPDNQRYKDVQDSLDSELANRRSRDYGLLVDAYNAGRSSTASLLEYVQNVLKTLDPKAADHDNWTGTQTSLAQRLLAEQDSQKFQDYQDGKVKPDAFLAYLTSRRDSYDPTSPDYADWQRKLDDATRQVKEAKLSAADATFFNAYTEGKKSDTDYLAYIKTRLDGMDTADPNYEAWRHRYAQASFSIAEDQLRFDVGRGTKPVGALISFYRNYRASLDPGSAEWRQITSTLDQLSGGGSVGGGRTAGGGGGGGGGGGPASGGVGKAIDPKAATWLQLLTIDPYAPKADRATAEKFFTLNYAALQNALQRGDPTWTFSDPRNPTRTLTLPTSNDALAELDSLSADYHGTLAAVALAQHDLTTYAAEWTKAINAQDHARVTAATGVSRLIGAHQETALAAISAAEAAGDFTAALNLGIQFMAEARAALGLPFLDDTRRAAISSAVDRLGQDKLFTQGPDGNLLAIDQANSSRNADGSFAEVVLAPGWHHTLDGPPGSAWGLTYDAAADPAAWAASHITVTTGYGPDQVTGEVALRPGTVRTQATTADGGVLTADVPAAQVASFFDEHGQPIRAYSLDGGTWVVAPSGTTPTTQFQGRLTKTVDPHSGAVRYTDAGGATVYTTNPDGSTSPVTGYADDHPGAFDWYRSGYFGAAPGEAPGTGQRGEIAGGAYGIIGSYGAPGQIFSSADSDRDPTSGQASVNLVQPSLGLEPSPTREIAGGAYGDTLRQRNQAMAEAQAAAIGRRGLQTAGVGASLAGPPPPPLRDSRAPTVLPPMPTPVLIPPAIASASAVARSRMAGGGASLGASAAPPPLRPKPVPIPVAAATAAARAKATAAGVGASLAGSATPKPPPPLPRRGPRAV